MTLRRGSVGRVAAGLIAVALAACAPWSADRATRAPAPVLTGTSWELVQVQSMDDAQGTVQVDDPARYTIHFAADGRAKLRIDCNRATATWAASAGRAGDAGSLMFGPVAGTRARCPPPSIDQRVVRDLPFVRSYLRRDGRLHMSLMADGGIYSWRPTARP